MDFAVFTALFVQGN